ncbi:MAG TPA: hypothetical protein VEF04_02740, partial [Blastocatellia bacterium]|nr:hypothetical protein [Blastocatellia bacterium]
LDDVYIHCRYAQNLLAGNGFSFNPSEAVSADTSPLWVLLIALAGLFTSHLEVAAVLLSALFYLIIAPGIYRIGRDLLGLEEHWAPFAAAISLLSSRLIWSSMSGMEVTLAALLALLLAEEHARQVGRGYFRIREGVLYGLAVLTRPELALLVVLCLGHWIYLRKSQVDISKLTIGSLIAVALLMPYVGFNLLVRGGFLPHSASVQGAGTGADLGYVWFATKILTTHNALLLIGAIIALITFRKKEWLPGLLFFALLIPLQAIFAPQYRHHGRYFFPLIPLLVLFGTLGVRHVFDQRQKLVPVVMIVAILLSAFDAIRWIALSGYSVRNINDQQVAAANWVKQHVSDSDRLAVHDVGAIAYLSDKPVIDLVGLVTPSLYPLQSDQLRVWQEA